MFKDKDIICFLGDSITANGLWMAEVYQTLRKKYKIKCFNCGVSGGTARKAAKYIQSECLIYNPDFVTVMFGINDIDRLLYDKSQENMPDIDSRRKAAINLCLSRYEEIIVQIINSGAKPIICIPVPYDEISDSETENSYCQCAMDELEKGFLNFAKKYDCLVVNFKEVFMSLLKTEKIISPDRVHPTPKGYHIMAQAFLTQMGEIEEPSYDGEFVFEEWNKTRYDLEQKLHMTNFAEYALLFDTAWDLDKTSEEKKLLAKKRYEEEENKEAFIAQSCLYYIDTIDFRFKMKGDVIKHTIF